MKRRLPKWQREDSDYLEWHHTWDKAWSIMPRHSAQLLLRLIGSYKIHGPMKERDVFKGTYVEGEGLIGTTRKVWRRYSLANNTVYTNMTRGSKPKCPIAAERLKALAGPHGLTVAKALAINLGIEFK